MPDKNWQFELEEYIKQGEPERAEKRDVYKRQRILFAGKYGFLHRPVKGSYRHRNWHIAFLSDDCIVYAETG